MVRMTKAEKEAIREKVRREYDILGSEPESLSEDEREIQPPQPDAFNSTSKTRLTKAQKDKIREKVRHEYEVKKIVKDQALHGEMAPASSEELELKDSGKDQALHGEMAPASSKELELKDSGLDMTKESCTLKSGVLVAICTVAKVLKYGVLAVIGTAICAAICFLFFYHFGTFLDIAASFGRLLMGTTLFLYDLACAQL